MTAPGGPPLGTATGATFAGRVLDGARVPSRVTLALGNALAFSVNGGPQAPAAAREQLADRLGPKLDPEIVELAQLLLSELITNCVQHGAAARPGVWINVKASIFPQALRIEVSDGGRPFVHEHGLPSQDMEAGRGLWLVAELSSRWGINDRGPARVWFELPRARATAPDTLSEPPAIAPRADVPLPDRTPSSKRSEGHLFARKSAGPRGP